MDLLDYLILLAYLSFLSFLGLFVRKTAASSLQSYFLANHKLSWIYLAMSGSVSNFDIAGTMFITSLLFLLGMKSMWVHMMWGVFMGAFFMAYMGRWVRSSQVLTPAEWMRFRFGNGNGGKLAQLSYAIMAIVTLTASIGYAFQGVGKFASVYLPFSPSTCALFIMGFTTFYASLGGFRAVVFSDVIQTVILSISAIIISGIAWYSLEPAQNYLDLSWASLIPPFTTDVPGFELFGLLVLAWGIKGILLNLGGPGQMYDFQRFLATKNPAEAAKTGAAWSLFLIVRWPMCMGIALLALNGIEQGIQDPEKVMPLVFSQYLPSGIRGFVLTGFFAAFMSTFSSVVNSGASFLVKDIWQEHFAPSASNQQLIKASYAASFIIVLAGVTSGLFAESITQIWNWIMMALGSGVIVPNVLRWYWWRMNGWGYSAGLLSGMISAFYGLYTSQLNTHELFLICTVSSSFTSIMVSYLTPPVDLKTLVKFYQSVRPFGAWKEVRARMPEQTMTAPETFPLSIFNVCLGIIVITGLYIGPMYFVGQWYEMSLLFISLSICASVILYFTWYQKIVQVWEFYSDETNQSATSRLYAERLSDFT